MTDSGARLDAIRREIDSLDEALLDLLSRRARAVLEVGAVKSGQAEPRYYRPERETAVIKRLAAINEGPLADSDVVRLFREIMSTCRSLEQRLKVGCATVGEVCAAIGYFGGAVEICAATDSGEALEAVADSRYDYSVIRFSDAFTTPPVVVALCEHELRVCAEWYAPEGERYLVVGTNAFPPTGDDWTAMVVPGRGVAAIQSWCEAANLVMRTSPISTVASSTLVEVALHADDPQIRKLIVECGGVVVGSYPNAGSRARP